MAVIGFRCDRCGDQIRQNRTLIQIQTGPLRPTRPTLDLCV